jgi:hypothetical protein
MSGPFLAGWLMLPLLWAGFYKAKKNLLILSRIKKQSPNIFLNLSIDNLVDAAMLALTFIVLLEGINGGCSSRN